VVAGTAGAVRHRQDERYAAKDQQAYEAQMAAQQQAQPQVVYAQAPAADDGGLAGELQRLADLKAQGILSDEEFEAAKAKLISG
jgi:multidrug resistance efflux pump